MTQDPTTIATKPGGPVRFARMAGSSIASRDAAAWVTDFLNAAYYRRPVDGREVDDMRLAFAVLTTYWYRHNPGRRLHVTDVRAFHKAFGAHRFDTDDSGRGLLSREQLLDGASRLIGDWFPDAYADDARRGWGIAFASVDERGAYDCDHRMRLARLGRLTPESAPVREQTWHTYPPVAMPSVEAVVGALTRPETWPDYASEIGRFTPLRPGGLAGQTFEIDAGHNRLLLYTQDGQAYVRAAGTWDPMPWHIDQAYHRAGQTAQHAFWGQGGVERLSMLHQLAAVIG